MKKIQVPIWEKSNLTIDEASSYFHIGAAKLREMTDNPACKLCVRDRHETFDQTQTIRKVSGK